jgi:glycosylphosphatidylinositol transamidase
MQTTSEAFLKVGHYLPAVILISVATMFGALSLWVDARWVQVETFDEDEDEDEKKGTGSVRWVTRDRPVLQVLGRMCCSHLTGYCLWFTSGIKSRFPVSFFIFIDI